MVGTNFSKRHYVLVAKLIGGLDVEKDMRDTLVESFCNLFRWDNHRFDRFLFEREIGAEALKRASISPKFGGVSYE